MKNIFKTIILFSFLCTITQLNGQNKQLERADQYFNNHEFTMAIKYYQKVIKKDSSNIYAMHQIGETYRLIGENQKANPWYGLALKVDPDSKQDLYYYARTLLTMGEYTKALDAYKKYNSLFPGDYRVAPFINTPNYVNELKKDSLYYSVSYLPFNSEMSDFGPTILYDKLLFTSSRERDIPLERKSTWENEPFLDLYTIDLLPNQTYGEIKLIEKPITSKYHVASASFDKKTNDLYFTRTTFSENEVGTENIRVKNLEIYYSHYNEDNTWGDLQPFPYNNKAYSIAQPAISDDGEKLYFVSDMPGGLGGTDIYVCEWNGSSWSLPQNIGAPVNTASHEKNPYVSLLGDLYFSSTGHLGLGGMDIYYARPTPNGFDNPVNLGYPINTRYDDFSIAFVDRTEQTLFFASNRPGGKGKDDIYHAKINIQSVELDLNVIVLETLQDIPIRIIISDEANNIIATDTLMGDKLISVTAKSKFSGWKVVLLPLFDDETLHVIEDIDPNIAINGKINLGDVILGEDVYVDEEENPQILPLDKHNLTPKPSKDEFFITMPSGEILKYEEQPIYFGFDEYGLTTEAKKELENLLEVMKQDPSVNLTISGNTDSRGSKEYNLYLSDKRANAARNYLVKNGIGEDRIVIQGNGEGNLVNGCSDGVNCSNAQHALNRRDEFKLFRKGDSSV